MTQRAFQAAVARLVVDPDFRDRVRAGGVAALDGDLTSLEEERVLSIVDEKGLDATRTLHKSFRLTKLYASLPLTRQLLGPARLTKEIGSFWQANPSDSHYFLDEAIAFCDFLLHRLGAGLRAEYLEDVVNYERANLNLLRARPEGEVAQAETVRFHHDPLALFEQLAKRKRPRGVRKLECTLIGSVAEDGAVHWRSSLECGDLSPLWPSVA